MIGLRPVIRLTVWEERRNNLREDAERRGGSPSGKK
jgi:hypothetical protein